METSRPRKTRRKDASGPKLSTVPLANISQLSVSNIKGFDDFSLPIPPPPEDRARWIILLGDNGVGKTTVLQCVALAMLGTWLNALLARSTVPAMVRMGNKVKQGAVDLTIAGQAFEVRLHPRKGSVPDRIEADMEKRSWPRLPAIFGYGVGRDTCAATTAENLSSAPVNSVHTLFDAEKATMVDPTAYLRKLEGNASRAKLETYEQVAKKKGNLRRVEDIPASDAERLYTSVCAVLKRALGVSKISVEKDTVFVEHSEFGRVPLDSLSSGYYAMARWLLDLIARYADFMDQNGQTLGPNFNEHLRAVVLVDEIDLYLHPSWQHRVIDDLRALFPETTFVVTTHNPLCLLGAKPGEIFILRRNEETNRIEAKPKDLPRGISPDEVLTGDWFDLPVADTIDDDTAKLMDEHRQLLRTKKRNTQQQRRLDEVESELTKRLEVPFHSRSIRNLLWAASELSEQERKAMDPLDTVASMSPDELKELVTKARKLAEGNEP